MRSKLFIGLLFLLFLSSTCFAQNAKYIYQKVDEFEGTDEPQSYHVFLSNDTEKALFSVYLRDGGFLFFNVTFVDNLRSFEESSELIVLIKNSDGELDRIVVKRHPLSDGYGVFLSDFIDRADRLKMYDADLIGVRLHAHNTTYTFKDNLSSNQKNYFKGIAQELEQLRSGNITLQVNDNDSSKIIK